MAKMRLVKTFLLYSLLTALFTVLFCAAALFSYIKFGIDPSLDVDMLFSEKGLTTKLYCTDAEGNVTELADQRLSGGENRIWIDGGDIPDHVKKAFIAIEDHRFYDHGGVDFVRTGGAVLHFFSPSGNYGGSTITQQLIKNLTGDSSPTVKRKLTEIVRAVELEKHKSKDEILTLYLNTVYLSQGCYGIEAASNRYFGKPASELSLSEGAALASIIQYPTKYDPIQNYENNDARRRTVLFRMHELGMIEDGEYSSALDDVIVLDVSKKAVKATNSWFTDCVISDVIAAICDKYGVTKATASGMVYGGGLSVYTTMSPEIQRIAEEVYAGGDAFPDAAGIEIPESAAVVIDPDTGAILALVGGRGEKRSDRIYNLATDMLRSPGSAIKPVSVYAPALDRGLITWASVFDDVPLVFTDTGDGYSLWPKNNPAVYSGLTTVARAVEISTNTVAVSVLRKLGTDASFDFLRGVGITTVRESYVTPSGKVLTDKAEAPLALGGLSLGVSLRELSAAYTIMYGGKFRAARSFYAVYDKNGELIIDNGIRESYAVSPDTADIMMRMLEKVTSTGTAKGMELKSLTEVAGKTGTTNANCDKWFIGCTPGFICGVWYGYPEPQDMGTSSVNPSVRIFDRLMCRVYRETETEKKTFSHSENVIEAEYCRDSGELPGEACALDPRGCRTERGWFLKGTEPKIACSRHVRVKYDEAGHGIATELCERCEAPKEKRLFPKSPFLSLIEKLTGEEYEDEAEEDEGYVQSSVVYTALLKIPDRSFPCEVTVADAQYVYRPLPYGTAPESDPRRPFFYTALPPESFIGISSTRDGKQYNRSCEAHKSGE